MFKRKLACSFCRRTEAEVAKLVAGPRVYICDRCAAEAVRIMNESDANARGERTTAGETFVRMHVSIWPIQQAIVS